MADFQIISPIDGSVYATRSYADHVAIQKTLERSQSVFSSWRSTPLEVRKEICQKAVNYLVEQADGLGQEITHMMGRPIRYTPYEIKGGFKERAEHMISLSESALQEIPASSREGFRRFIRKEPLGTILVLSPWNYPYLTSVNAVIPALLAGNCVILKHADQTALCAERYAEAFSAAGLPEGVFQFLHLTHGQTAELVQDSGIAHIAFTGSVEGGKAIQNALNERFITCGLELGGKDPAYVRADVELPFAVENLVDGAYFNSGQSCCGIERIYVHDSIYDSFINLFAQTTINYTLGDPRNPEVTLGPVVRDSNAKKIRLQIDKAIENGARTLIDPSSFPNFLGSNYLPPQILLDVDHSMEIMQEETFGPVVGIMSVRDDEEALKLMNDSKYGLTASIWTRDINKALEIGDQLETGTFFVNRCDYLDPTLAWTGVKDSGKGCTLSTLGFDQFVRPKSFHIREAK